MCDFIISFVRILWICKDFAGGSSKRTRKCIQTWRCTKVFRPQSRGSRHNCRIFQIQQWESSVSSPAQWMQGRSPNLINRRQFNVPSVSWRPDLQKNPVGCGYGYFRKRKCVLHWSKPVRVCQDARAECCVMRRDNPKITPDLGRQNFSSLFPNVFL